MNIKLNIFRNIIITTIFLMCGFVLGQSPFSGLVLEQLNNEGSVAGTTYRIYANLSEGKLYAIYADELNPSLLETDGSFFNNSIIGGDFQNEVNTVLFGDYPTGQWDTWVTIGDSYDDPVSVVGDLNINDFNKKKFATFLIKPDNTLPGPISTNVFVPCEIIY